MCPLGQIPYEQLCEIRYLQKFSCRGATWRSMKNLVSKNRSPWANASSVGHWLWLNTSVWRTDRRTDTPLIVAHRETVKCGWTRCFCYFQLQWQRRILFNYISTSIVVMSSWRHRGPPNNYVTFLLGIFRLQILLHLESKNLRHTRSTTAPPRQTTAPPRQKIVSHAEFDIGRVHPWVGSGRVGLSHKIIRLGWVGLSRVQCQKYLINIQFTCKKPIVWRLS